MDANSPPRKSSLVLEGKEIKDAWRPRTVGKANGQVLKLAKMRGSFIWHCHRDEDEAFLGVTGQARVEFRDGSVELGPGDLVVVPRGVEHRPVSEDGALVLLFTPEGTRNTGNVEDPVYTAP